MAKILATLACNLDIHILQASLPLFDAEKVEAVEWSFDTLFHYNEIPEWFLELIQAFSQENRLIGHGVYFSLFGGKWTKEQTKWLQKLTDLTQKFHFSHISEHFGFMTGEDFHKGAPLNIPFTPTTLALGRDRLKRIQAACQCPVGLENLAFAYSLDEVKKQGDFLAQLLEPINGFIILDLHNLYCQIHNFKLSFEEIMAFYPLEKVREIHISGGSWENAATNVSEKIRRDTHDNAVPKEVFILLEKTIPLCPHVQYVVLEQMGIALKTETEQYAFQQDFLQMEVIVSKANFLLGENEKASFLPQKNKLNLDNEPFASESLYLEQQQLSHILENAQDYQQAQQLLAKSKLANSAWQVEKWSPDMLATAMAIAQKWKNGFPTPDSPHTTKRGIRQ